MNSMDIMKKGPEVFEITRRTPRARWMSWGGTFAFAQGLLFAGYQAFVVLTGSSSLTDVLRIYISSGILAFRWGLLAVLLFVIAIILWVISAKSQRGTISFNNDRISCKCVRTFLDILPEQVSSVQRHGNLVKIIYSGKTLTVKSEKAPQITDRVQDFINAYRYSDKRFPSASFGANLSPHKIREYKKLVDDGVISQEQFDEIIKKMTKLG